MSVYGMLGDWVLSAIAASEGEGLSEARRIHARIVSRDLYRCAASLTHSPLDTLPHGNGLFFFLTAHISYGSEREVDGRLVDPLNHVRFFNPKHRCPIPHAMNPSSGLFNPSSLEELTVFVCVKDTEAGPAAAAVFREWKETQGGREPSKRSRSEETE